MSTPDFARSLLGWRADTPNIADGASEVSTAISAYLLSELKVLGPPDTAARFDLLIAEYLEQELRGRRSDVEWRFDRHVPNVDFAQYAHLTEVARCVTVDETGVLAAELGADYIVRPDITVSLRHPGETSTTPSQLHAAIACRWTIRSDRIQNLRNQAQALIRHRRGRLPHIVTITAEPLPSRLAAIALKTGDIDAVYHLALDELLVAAAAVAPEDQLRLLRQLVDQKRLLPLDSLSSALAA